MKYIKLYESFKSSDIEEWLNKNGIINYTINDDGTIDVDQYVNLRCLNITKLPFKFGKVSSDFICASNYLETLENCPYYVGGSFDCSVNRLTNLVGSPVEVVGNFDCSYNELISLEGMPLEIGGHFGCDKNPNLLELDSVSNIEGDILCDNHVDITKFRGYCKNIDNS